MEWELKKIPVTELKEYDKNPRKFTSKGLADLKKSIEKFGVAEPLVVNNDYEIIGGHGRLATLKDLGVEFVDCYFPKKTLTKKQVEELNIRLNKNIAGEWDFDLLSGFDEEMLVDIGWDGSELDKIFVKDNSDLDEFDAPDESEAITKLGDIYLLGKHRLMCGDSTKIEDVEKLMDGQKADMSFTSPPYNVGHNLGYKGKNSKYINSDDDLDDYIDLIVKSTQLSLDNAREVFVNIQLLANNKRQVLLWLAELSDKFKDIFYWKKLQVAPAMAKNVANSQVEVIVLFGNDNNSRSWGNKEFRGNFSNYIETPSAKGENKNSDIHNATFPVRLPATFIQQGYKEQSIVLDLFGGSGTTLIACEQLNRKCYMMEIDPKYCDVIISRWENLTNKKAEKIK